MPDDYDKMWQLERDDEQARWDEAEDNASLDRAERFNEHSEDVP